MSENGKLAMLTMYTDLTWARYTMLKEAKTGTLKKMNGAMHEAISNMVDDQYRITRFGRNVLIIAEKIMAGNGEMCSPLESDTETRLRNANIRLLTKRIEHGFQHLTKQTVRTVHTKLIISLAIHPLQSYRYLAHVYGYSTISALKDMDLIKGIRWNDLESGFDWNDGCLTGVPWNLAYPEETIQMCLQYTS